MGKALDPAAITSFGKLLRLLASSHDGERAAAAQKATNFLKSRKLDWHDIVSMLEGSYQGELDPPPTPPWQPPQNTSSGAVDHTVAASACLNLFNTWSEKEENFLYDMQWIDLPTARQMQWLQRLYERYLRIVRG